MQGKVAVTEAYNVQLLFQGVTKRRRLSWLANSALVYEPKCGRGEGGGGVGSQPMSAQGAQINFGDLTPYLTHVLFSSVQEGIP